MLGLLFVLILILWCYLLLTNGLNGLLKGKTKKLSYSLFFSNIISKGPHARIMGIIFLLIGSMILIGLVLSLILLFR